MAISEMKGQGWILILMEWDYSGRKGRDGTNKKVDKANKKMKK